MTFSSQAASEWRSLAVSASINLKASMCFWAHHGLGCHQRIGSPEGTMIHITTQGITNVVFRASIRRIMLLQAESKNRHSLLDADNCSLRPKSTWRDFSEINP
jgi:hypothetical protein